MQIISTFFNNDKYYMNIFIEWYTKIWKANNFVFFIGKTNLEKVNYKFEIDFNVFQANNITIYEYKSSTNTPQQWHNLKELFRQIIGSNHNIWPTLWIDCDEFIYCKDIKNVLKNNFFKTHFYEYVPIKPFNFNDDSLWCVCPWYYRMQAMNLTEINHKDCKSYNFYPTQYGGHMGYPNGYCNPNSKLDDYENICFHIGVYSKEHYLNSKHWLQTHPNGIEISDNDRQSGILLNNFEQYYQNCRFDTFNLNLANKYLTLSNKII